jgi:hypothetical protein
MKQISYRALIKEIGTKRVWVEDFADLVVDSTTSLSHCRFLICRFNATLREGEKPRRVRITRPTEIPDNLKEHSWNKMSFELVDGKYYIYKCRMCGITGKRYGTVTFVTPDRKSTIYCKK